MLSFLMLVVALPLVSCNGDNKVGNNDNNGEQPQGKVFNNADYTILSRLTTAYEFDNSGEGTDDKVQRKIWERNVFIKDTYDVNVNVITEPGDYDKRDSFIAKVRSSASSGEDEFSLISTHSSYLQSMAIEGLGIDLGNLPEINPTADWWSESYYNTAKINDSVYALIGDISLTLYEYIEVVFFNVTLAEEYHVGDLYKTVTDGNWTLDKMMELTRVAAGFSNQAQEQYGLLSNSHATNSFAVSLGFKYTNKDGSTGQQKFRTTVPSKMDEAYKKILSFYSEDAVRYGMDGSTDENVSNPLFSNGKALFYLQMLGQAEYFAAAMTDHKYSVLPFPKLEEGANTGYKSTCRDSLSAQLIPISVIDKEMVGTVTEAMCKFAHEQITPEYYEQRLKFRYFDDYQVQTMLDYVRAGLAFDFAQIYGTAIAEWPYSSFSVVSDKNQRAPGSETLAFHWKSNQQLWNASLRELYATFDKLKKEN